MDPGDMVTLSLEGSFSVLLIVLAYKLYRMKIKSHSGCCLDSGNGIVLSTQNSGVTSEEDIVLNNL